MAGTAITRDRTTLATGAILLVVALAAWAELLLQPAMAMPRMPDLLGGIGFLVAWGIMMVAMMLPSAVPMIALYGVVRRNAAKTGQKSLPPAVFTLTNMDEHAVTFNVFHFQLAHLDPAHAGRIDRH